MYISRSESHQHDKRRRKKKVRRLLAINLTMLGVIIILFAVWFVKDDWELGSILPFGNDEQHETAKTDPSGEPAGSQDNNAVSPDPAGNSPSLGSNNDNNDTASPEVDNEVEIAPDEGVTPEDEPSNESAGVIADDSDKVRLAFVGDILLAESVGNMMKIKGNDFPFTEALLYLSEPDLTAANLEYPITKRGVPAEDKTYVFKGTPDALPALKNSGVDVVSLANNHTLDQGVDGLLDTMGYLDEAGIDHMGAGSNDTEAFAPKIREVRGIKIAYIGLSKVVPTTTWKADKYNAGVAETYDTTRAVAAIAKAKKEADIVVVMVHWGIEKSDTPEKYQRDFAREYIDAGADLVIGSHPHVLQGFETYKGKWIAYSLGNFIFSVTPKGRSGETGVLDATCTKKGDCELQFYPMYADNAQPKPMDADKAKALLDRLTSLSFKVKLRDNGAVIPD
ncbi:MAG: CapA family protein [Candidatus Pristimantibacillus sp.]